MEPPLHLLTGDRSQCLYFIGLLGWCVYPLEYGNPFICWFSSSLLRTLCSLEVSPKFWSSFSPLAPHQNYLLTPFLMSCSFPWVFFHLLLQVSLSEISDMYTVDILPFSHTYAASLTHIYFSFLNPSLDSPYLKKYSKSWIWKSWLDADHYSLTVDPFCIRDCLLTT